MTNNNNQLKCRVCKNEYDESFFPSDKIQWCGDCTRDINQLRGDP